MWLLAALALTPPQLATIDYTAFAKPLRTVLRELNEMTGETWRASKSLEDDIIVVRVRNVTADELRARLAEAAVGSWKAENDSFVLSQDAEKLRDRSDARRADAARKLCAEIALFCKDVLPISGITEEHLVETAGKGYETLSIAEALLSAFLVQLNCYDAVGMVDRERRVYATTNNRLQRPISGLSSQLSLGLQAQRRFADLAARADIEEPEVGTIAYLLRQSAITKWVGPLRLTVSVEWAYGTLFIGALVADSNGKVVDRALFEFAYQPEASAAAPESLLATEPSYSQDYKQFEMFAMIGTPALLEDLDPRFVAKLRKPTVYDPLSFNVAERLAEIGRICDWNVVAFVTDEMYYYEPDLSPSISTWFDYIQRMPSISLVVRDSWLLLGSSGYRTEPQINRRALESLVDSARDKLPRLHEVARYASVATGSLLELVLIPPFAGFYPDWTWLKLYDKLSEAERLRLWNSETIPLGVLSPAVHDDLQRIVMNGEGSFEHDDWDSLDERDMTDILPMGLPPNAVLRPAIESGYSLLQIKPRNLRASSRSRSIDSIAGTVALRQHTEGSGAADFPWQLAPFVFGIERSIVLTLGVAQRTYGDILFDPEIDRNAAPVTEAPLPRSLQESFDAAVARHLRRLRGGTSPNA